MKIIFQKDVICAAVQPLMSGISTKNTIPAAECILIEAMANGTCVMTTYDLEKGVRVTVEASVIDPGSYIINASKFGQTVRAMDGDTITLSVDAKNCATITSGKSSHTMSALNADDFPEIPKLYSNQGVSVNAKTLRTMISKCMFAMGIKDQRAILNGMYFAIDKDELKLVSCDSFKLAVCSTHTEIENIDEENTEAYKFILPNRSVSEIYKLMSGVDEDVSMYLTKKSIVFDMGNVIFFSKLIEGEYLDYNRIIVRNHRIFVEVDREQFLSSLERASLITEEKSGSSHVKLTTQGDMLQISATSGAGSAYDEISAIHDGEDIIIAFNNRYLMDTLRASSAEKVKLSLSSPRSSMNIEPADPDTEDNAGDSELFMILPVRMKD